MDSEGGSYNCNLSGTAGAYALVSKSNFGASFFSPIGGWYGTNDRS